MSTEPNSFANHAVATPAEVTEPNQGAAIQVGDRTFNSQEELIKSWEHAQAHITSLDTKISEADTALAKSVGMQEVLEKLQSTSVAAPQTVEPTAVNEGYLKEDDIDKILGKRERDKAASSNVDSAMTLAESSLGTDYIAKLNTKAAELGMTVEAAIAIAKDSPTAFSKLFIPSELLAQSSSVGDINTAAITPAPAAEPSMRVPMGSTTTTLLAAWAAAKPN